METLIQTSMVSWTLPLPPPRCHVVKDIPLLPAHSGCLLHINTSTITPTKSVQSSGNLTYVMLYDMFLSEEDLSLALLCRLYFKQVTLCLFRRRSVICLSAAELVCDIIHTPQLLIFVIKWDAPEGRDSDSVVAILGSTK